MCVTAQYTDLRVVFSLRQQKCPNLFVPIKEFFRIELCFRTRVTDQSVCACPDVMNHLLSSDLLQILFWLSSGGIWSNLST